jgi:hypothetical protein
VNGWNNKRRVFHARRVPSPVSGEGRGLCDRMGRVRGWSGAGDAWI